MSVITRVYDDYESARVARNNVNALGLSEVNVSILGNESIRQYHEADSGSDTMMGYGNDTTTGYRGDTMGDLGDDTTTGYRGDIMGGLGNDIPAGYRDDTMSGFGDDTTTGYRNDTMSAYREDTLSGYSDAGVADPDASGTATGAGIGAAIGGGAGLLAGIGMLAIPGIGPLVAAGWLAATAVGAAGGAVAGGTVGALVDLGLSDEDAPVFSEAMRRGSVAVSVQFPESARQDVEGALDSVLTSSLSDRRSIYERDGWSGM